MASNCVLVRGARVWRANSHPAMQYPVTTDLPCSGNGDCINGTCVCYAGWSGNGDWARTKGLDCQVNEATHTALHVLLAVIYISVSAWAFPRVWAAYTKLRNKRTKAGKKASIVENRAIISLLWRIFVTTPLVLVLVIIELASEMRVAQDGLPTVIFFLLRSSIYFDAYLFFPYVMTQLVGSMGGHNTRKLIQTNDLWSALLTCVNILVGILSFIALGVDDAWVTLWTYVAFQILVGLCFLAMAGTAHWIMVHICRVLDESYKIAKNEQILDVKIKLRRSMVHARNSTIFQALICWVVGAVPYLMNKYVYVLPLIFTLSMSNFPGLVRALAEGKAKEPTQDSSKKHVSTTKSSGHKEESQKAPYVYGLEGADKVLSDPATSLAPKAPVTPGSARVANEFPDKPGSNKHGDGSNRHGASGSHNDSHRSLTPTAHAIVSAALTPSRKLAQMHHRFLFDDPEVDITQSSVNSTTTSDHEPQSGN